ncbi:tRNA pseudouridine13 synthase [Volucribacter psittacicida]|uniref:tRNA pseudouridine synthase D n=1 Tax=Volucribacter psittacicida TaxID=203482 RepID=A0A4V2PBU7_9PAST|nr:tRNA pseudouridine(13) synthase TruD [Volucribacter psittacicida]TCJ98765.1 tRNA pseudouridine13 synthase [Volucribacter psittacicida]
MLALAYLKTLPKQTALLKAQCEDFCVVEDLGYPLTCEGEFVLLWVRKRDCNTLFVAEKLAQFAGIPLRQVSYAGLKDRKAVTEQWFCLHLPKQTPDFSQFHLEGVEILQVTRHQRKVRIGSLAGNHFQLLLRNVVEEPALLERLQNMAQQGVPNYFTEQRFGRDGHNLTQAIRWANGEIKVKDRHKRSFYLSAARSEIFNQIVSARLEQGLIEQVMMGDIVQLSGSQSWFKIAPEDDLTELQQRLQQRDLYLTGALIGEDIEKASSAFEQEIIPQYSALLALMQREKVKTLRRPLLLLPQHFTWQFVPEGLQLAFYLPAGSYATAVVRELVNIEEN